MHCSVLVWTSFLLLFHLFEQKQACSKNVYIRIINCTKCPHIHLKTSTRGRNENAIRTSGQNEILQRFEITDLTDLYLRYEKKIDKFTLTAIAVPTNLKTTPSFACQTEPLLVPGSNFYTKRCWENFLKIFWKSIRQKMLIVVWKHKFCGVKLGQIIFSWGKIESIKEDFFLRISPKKSFNIGIKKKTWYLL